jgi:hypothetical protein
MFYQDTGTEQHRHHAVEIALYNMYSILWEIETGSVYKMSKAHDIYSGLGTQDQKIDITRTDDEETKAIEDEEAGKKDVLDAITEGNEEEEEAESITVAGTEPHIAVATSSSSSSNSIGKDVALQALDKKKKQEATLVKAIQRAETIVQSYENLKVRSTLFCSAVCL